MKGTRSIWKTALSVMLCLILVLSAGSAVYGQGADGSFQADRLVGSRTISSVFLDRAVAEKVARSLNKHVDDMVTQSDLDRVQSFYLFTSFEDKAEKSLEGVQYLHSLQELNVSFCYITDISPLRGLTGLKSLDLGYNQIEDISPLRGLRLEKLVLTNNKIEKIDALGDMTTLRSLSLGGNPISDIEPLKKLTGLEELDLSQTQVKNISLVAELTKLRSLSLTNLGIQKTDSVENLRSLVYLHLDYNHVTDISGLKNLTNLEGLGLTGNGVKDIEALGEMKRLQYAFLGDNRIEDITPLAGQTKMSFLDLSNNRITDIGPLRGMVYMQDLDLSRNPIKDLSALNTMTRLEWLKLRDLDINSLAFVEHMPNIKSLVLSGASVRDLSPLRHVQGSLRYLTIEECPNVNLATLPPMPELYALRAGKCNLQNLSFLSQGYPALSDLDITFNDITDFTALGNAKNIMFLSLYGNGPVRDIAPLLSMPELKYLYAYSDQLSSSQIEQLEAKGISVYAE